VTRAFECSKAGGKSRSHLSRRIGKVKALRHRRIGGISPRFGG
jgi:hypothetical protein